LFEFPPTFYRRLCNVKQVDYFKVPPKILKGKYVDWLIHWKLWRSFKSKNFYNFKLLQSTITMNRDKPHRKIRSTKRIYLLLLITPAVIKILMFTAAKYNNIFRGRGIKSKDRPCFTYSFKPRKWNLCKIQPSDPLPVSVGLNSLM